LAFLELLDADRSGATADAGSGLPWVLHQHWWPRFPATAASGWKDPGFFPVVAWFDGVSSDAEVEYDKALGFSAYAGVGTATQCRLFVGNGVRWIGGALKDQLAHGVRNWVGYLLAGEADGRFTPASAELAYLRSLRDAQFLVPIRQATCRTASSYVREFGGR